MFYWLNCINTYLLSIGLSVVRMDVFYNFDVIGSKEIPLAASLLPFVRMFLQPSSLDTDFSKWKWFIW